VLPITCIAIVLHLGHTTGGARVLMWTCLSLVADCSHSEHLLWHCLPDIPVATHHNWFFSEPPMTTHNWLFWEPPTSQRTQQTFSQMKKFCSSQVIVVTFLGGRTSRLQTVFLWDNVNNQKFVWIILLTVTFLDFPRYSGYIWQARCTICKIFVWNFISFSLAKNH